mgnify:CR=1 FL=1
MSFIPYGRQDISQEDIDAVVDILRSDFLTQGPTVYKFEKCLAEYCGAKYAVAVNSATSALHIACLALDVGMNDTVWTSPNSFVASANCALNCGAKIDFVDICDQTFNISIRNPCVAFSLMYCVLLFSDACIYMVIMLFIMSSCAFLSSCSGVFFDLAISSTPPLQSAKPLVLGVHRSWCSLYPHALANP